jgi:DNA replication and repair protein RecF
MEEEAKALTQLVLRNFRCFSSLVWEPQPGLNFILGPNAQGKTSILEAVCMLLRLKSPRTSHLSEMVRFDEQAFVLEGDYAGCHLKYQATPSEEPKRHLEIDEVSQRGKSDYLSLGKIVWFGNEDVTIINGGAERRRKFLDSAGLQLGDEYRRTLRFYEKALRSRNLLLREGRSRKEIEAYDHPLAESGDRLITLRSLLVQELAPRVAAAVAAISGEICSMEYQPGASMPLLEALKNSRPEEARLRMTQVGPHRDDVSITLNDLPAGTFASEGQQRTIALALKLGLASFLDEKGGYPPLLLLDDIFGELDLARRKALLANIPQGSQAFLTTTHLRPDDHPSSAAFFYLEGGVLSRE